MSEDTVTFICHCIFMKIFQCNHYSISHNLYLKVLSKKSKLKVGMRVQK